MITITRDLARLLRAVLRKAGASRKNPPILAINTGHGELHVRAQLPEITIEYKQQGTMEQEAIQLPFEALEEFEAKSQSIVTLVRTSEGIDASWDEGRIPKRKSYPVRDSAIWPTIPEMDWSKKVVVPAFLQALSHASQCIAEDQIRFATNKIQLRGDRGEVISTDGRQALMQAGFSFPWKEDLLIPGLALFACRELPLDLPATVG